MSQVTVERNGSRIELRGWVGNRTPTLCKSVAGARWNPDGKFWAYPLDLSTCRALRSAFGDALVIGSELNSWARDALAAEKHLKTLAASTDADLVNVPRFAPAIFAAMQNRTYQKVGAAFGARAGNFLLADQPGLGKTIETLGALIESNGGTPTVNLVVAPKLAVTLVWEPEIERWLGDDARVFALTGTRAQREATLAKALSAMNKGDSVFVLANIEMLRVKPHTDENGKRSYRARGKDAEWPALFDVEWDSVIMDESHRALVRTKSKGLVTQVYAGINSLTAKRRIALSGTPMRGKPEQLWGTLNWLRPELFTSYWRWVETYFVLKSNGFSNYVIDGFQSDGQERLALDLQNVMLRRTKGEVLAELPPKTYAGSYLIPHDDNSPYAVWLDMDPKQERMYRALLSEGAIEFEDGTEVIADGVLALNTREKQLAGACATMNGVKMVPVLPSPKFDWIVEKLGELGILDDEGDGKIVIASQFTSLLNLFAKELTKLGVKLHLLTGETPDSTRRTMNEDFQNNPEVRVFMLNTKAGGVAITLDAADDLVLLDETFVPDDQEQVEDRIHRVSRMHNVTIHNLRTLGTIEEEIAWVTAAREDVTKYLLDGSRGIETARALYEAKAAA